MIGNNLHITFAHDFFNQTSVLKNKIVFVVSSAHGPQPRTRNLLSNPNPVESHNVAELKRLFCQHPEWPIEQWRLDQPFRAAAYHLETFKEYVERFPQTKGWACGHAGNPVGLAAAGGNVELLRGLLEDVGLKSNEGWFFYTPILYAISRSSTSPHKAEIIKLLKDHGATMEGEGAVWQKSHRLWNGKLCWHKEGRPDPPRCTWTEEWDKTKGPVERMRHFFALG